MGPRHWLLGQRFLAGVLRKAAHVLDARLFVVSGNRVERRLDHRLFHYVLARDLHPAVILHAGAGRNQPAHDHVLLEAAQVIHLAVDGGFGEYARGLLEGRRGDERIGGERCLGDAEQHRLALRRTPARFNHALVFGAELELVKHFLGQKFGVADIFHLYPAHHLARYHFEVLIVDIHALQTVNFLDLVDQVLLQLLFAQHVQNVVRVARTVHERLAGFHPLTLLHVDVHAARQRILALLAVVAHHVDLALSLGHFAVFHNAVDLRDDGRLARLARFEQLHHARQTAGDVLGFGGLARNLRQHIARVDFFAVANHQVRVGRHEVLLGVRARALRAFRTHDDSGLPLLVGRIHHHQLRHAGHFVHLLLQRNAVEEILEVDRAGDFSQDRERIRIPFEQVLIALHGRAVFGQNSRAIYHLVALLLAALIVHHRDDAVAVHGDQLAGLAANRLNADVLGEAIELRILRGLLVDSRSGSTDVERTHGELRARLADGLRRDHADRFAALHQTP